ncbi:MAG: SRPBCC family protein [Anaerolineales bacterium]
MIKNEMSIFFHRPVQEVFDFISDFRNGPQWQSGLLGVGRITEYPLGVGTRFTSVRKFMGRKMESGIEFTAFEVNKKFAIRSYSGSSPFKQTFLFEDTGEGTRVKTVFELELGGLMSLAEPLVAPRVRREMKADFETLREIIESRVMMAHRSLWWLLVS